MVCGTIVTCMYMSRRILQTDLGLHYATWVTDCCTQPVILAFRTCTIKVESVHCWSGKQCPVFPSRDVDLY